MTATVSPLDIVLDTQNPRFVILEDRTQENIIKYLVEYEDVCELATNISSYGGLLPGERLVVLRENDKYVVVEGNRRTCVLKLLLSRELIPDKFSHRFPIASKEFINNCSAIEVDVLSDRKAAIELMSKRHIEGVKQWKPLAKKQFFAVSYDDGKGKSVKELSEITGLKQGEITGHIRDYKFFTTVYQKYCDEHPDFDRTIVNLKTDPFWRIFTVKFEYPAGNMVTPKKFLNIQYDKTHNTISGIQEPLFEQIAQLVFKEAIVEERITTRHKLSDVKGIEPLLLAVTNSTKETETDDDKTDDPNGDTNPQPTGSGTETAGGANQPTPPQDNGGKVKNPSAGSRQSGGPRPGGPSPRKFFENVYWRDKLDPEASEHAGLLIAINELYSLSRETCKGETAYHIFPVGTGMVLRTVYEQALRLRMKEVGIWGEYMSTLKRGGSQLFPTLKTMENHICSGENLTLMFPDETIKNCFNRVKTLQHREFLNANIHTPGEIRVTAESLVAITDGGLFALIQGIINYL